MTGDQLKKVQNLSHLDNSWAITGFFTFLPVAVQTGWKWREVVFCITSKENSETSCYSACSEVALADQILDTNCVEVHVVDVVLIDFKHSVPNSEAAVFCRTPRFHVSDLKSLATLVRLHVKAKALSLQTLQLTQSGHQALVRLCAHGSLKSRTNNFKKFANNSVKALELNLTRIISDDQSWIIDPFLWIEGKTEGKQKKSW